MVLVVVSGIRQAEQRSALDAPTFDGSPGASTSGRGLAKKREESEALL
jgi:hypothetical protein